MSPLKASNPSKVGPEKGNIVEAQDKDLKKTFMNIIEVLKEKMNKSLFKNYENTNKQWKEIKRNGQDLKVEIEIN